MFSLTIVFGTSPVPWTLIYKAKESFDAAQSAYHNSKATSFEGDELNLTDDFGQTCSIKRASIHGALFEDLDQSRLAHVERGLHQMRTQIAADKAGMAAPDISAYMKTRSMGGGPAVLSPGFNGAFRQ